ncbi:MAG: hypothetical protein R3E55_07985 [Burkholderiaceae bacterium]
MNTFWSSTCTTAGAGRPAGAWCTARASSVAKCSGATRLTCICCCGSSGEVQAGVRLEQRGVVDDRIQATSDGFWPG